MHATTARLRRPVARLRRLVALVAALLAAVLATAVQGTPAAAADPVGPVLTAVSVDSAALGPGQTTQLHYAATSADPLAKVSVLYSSSLVIPYTTADGANPALDGTVDISFPQGSRNAPTPLSTITLTDTAGRSSTWYANGSVRYAGGAAGPTTHQVSFAPAQVTLSGFTEDREAPLLSSLALTGSGTLVPGDPLAVAYASTDASSIIRVTVTFTNVLAGISRNLDVRGPSTPSTGTLAATIDNTWANGVWTASTATVVDRYVQQTFYYPTSASSYPSTAAPALLDLSGLRFTVSGSTADYDPPELAGLGPMPAAVLVGSTMSVPYSATDASGGLSSLTVLLRETTGRTVRLSGTDLPLTGTLTGLAVPEDGALGKFWVEEVDLTDLKGHQRRYLEGGQQYVNGHSTVDHTLDLPAWSTFIGRTPAATQYLQVVPGEGSLSAVWDEAWNQGVPVTGYTLSVSPSGRSISVPATARRATITGLTNTTSYTVTLRATSLVGAGAPASRTAIPRLHGQRLISPGDFDEDGRTDIVGVNRSGQLYLYRGNGRGGFSGRGVLLARSWQDERILLPRKTPRESGLIGNVWSVNFDGSLVEHQRTGTRSIGAEWTMSTGWGGMAKVFNPGDWSGDGMPDVMGIKDNGDLYYYRWNDTSYRFYSGVRLGHGWGGFRQVMAVGDQTGDGRGDLLGLRTDGTLWLYPGNGRGGFKAGAARKLTSGFGGARAIFCTDFNGGGPDLLTVDSKGSLRLYAGNNRGRFTSKGVIGTGWGAFL